MINCRAHVTLSGIEKLREIRSNKRVQLNTSFNPSSFIVLEFVDSVRLLPASKRLVEETGICVAIPEPELLGTLTPGKDSTIEIDHGSTNNALICLKTSSKLDLDEVGRSSLVDSGRSGSQAPATANNHHVLSISPGQLDLHAATKASGGILRLNKADHRRERKKDAAPHLEPD
nr:hypothetical protein Iba_chr01bCG2290 [Ipomoea batatas]